MVGVKKVELQALWSGGYIAVLKNQSLSDNNTENLKGHVLDNDGRVNSTWEFPDNLIVPKSAQMRVFRNNTYSILLQNSYNNSWSIM